jgi:hypothetical protein
LSDRPTRDRLGSESQPNRSFQSQMGRWKDEHATRRPRKVRADATVDDLASLTKFFQILFEWTIGSA